MTASLQVAPRSEFISIVGASAGLRHAIRLAERFALHADSILVIGETGTGKELLAKLIHRSSGCAGNLVSVNCATLRPELATSLLFGHARGAFTSAFRSSTGHVVRARDGWLFLDELASLPAESQAVLLRALDSGEVAPVGSSAAPMLVNFRVVATLQGDVAALLHSGALRRDLYERLAVAVVTLPPLRERRDDIEALAGHFARQYQKLVSPGAIRALRRYSWPANVRELRFVIERAAILCLSGVIAAAAIEEAIAVRPAMHSQVGIDQRQLDRERLESLCHEARGEWRRLAAVLNTSRSSLYRMLARHGIRLRRYRRRVPDIPTDSQVVPGRLGNIWEQRPGG